MDPKFHDYTRGICGPLFHSQLLSDDKTLNAETLLLHTQNSHSPRFWQCSPLRCRNPRNSAICSREDGERFGLGIGGSLPQSHFQDFRHCKEVELSLRAQSCCRGRTSGENPGSRKAHSGAGANIRASDHARRAGSDHGATGAADRLANWRDFWLSIGSASISLAVRFASLGVTTEAR